LKPAAELPHSFFNDATFMTKPIAFAVNRICALHMPLKDFFDMVVRLGVRAIEFRNTPGAPFKDYIPATVVRDMCMQHGLELLSLNPLYPFDQWSAEREEQARQLARYSRDCGAPVLTLVPLNSPDDKRGESKRGRDLVNALNSLKPILQEFGLMGRIEPLGFPQCSLRLKSAALCAIAESGGGDTFDLVHDTFHHELAGEKDYFPQQTGLVQISGVAQPTVPLAKLVDGQRALVGNGDVLRSVDQVRTLLEMGYDGYVSFEAFSKDVQQLDASQLEAALSASMRHVEARVAALR
jgi:2-keto-myo-inositol isomerase